MRDLGECGRGCPFEFAVGSQPNEPAERRYAYDTVEHFANFGYSSWTFDHYGKSGRRQQGANAVAPVGRKSVGYSASDDVIYVIQQYNSLPCFYEIRYLI